MNYTPVSVSRSYGTSYNSGVPTTASALYAQRYREAMNSWSQLSDQQKKDLAQSFQNAYGGMSQAAVNSGLVGATTYMGPMYAGLARQKAAASAELNDTLLRERLGIMSEYTQGQASAMEAAANRRQQQTLANQSNELARQQMAQQAALAMSRRSSGSTRRTAGYGSVYNGRVNYHPGGAGYLSQYR